MPCGSDPDAAGEVVATLGDEVVHMRRLRVVQSKPAADSAQTPSASPEIPDPPIRLSC
jgi:hypothetical protein